MKKLLLLVLYVALQLQTQSLLAKQEARSIAADDHIKVMNYNSQSVHSYTGFYGYQSSILFDVDETITTVSMGDPGGWQMLPQGNRLFIKPISDNAATNATIITNRRVYYFEFHAEEATGLDDPRLAYEVRFMYPSTDVLNSLSNDIMQPATQTEIPDLTDVEVARKGLNFSYSVAHSLGSENLVPLKIFDDGRFTYMQFQNINADIPSIFHVDSGGYESLINFRTVSDYIIIERVSSVFTLRHGSDTVCVFNDNRPFRTVKNKKRK